MRSNHLPVPSLSLAIFVLGVVGLSQASNAQAQPLPPPQAPAQPAAGQQQAAIRPNYVLGANDQVLVRVPQADEINERPFRIDAEGFITFPIVGKVRASGQTVMALEADLTTRLREFIREPQVGITVVQFRSEFVFLVGAFRAPGIYPLPGRQTLVEMLASVGGLLPNASRRIRITRRADYGAIPLPNAVVNPEKRTATVEISLKSLTEDVNPAEDITLQAYDVISAERAERIYVSGDVTKVGSIELGERDTISVSQALTEAGGFTQFATRDKVRVLRPVLGTSRRAEIDIDMKRVFEGKDIDFPLLPNDVLFIPRSSARSLLSPVGASILTTLPYLVITTILR